MKQQVDVLVIDDEAQMCSMIASYFEERGISVLTASCVEEAEILLELHAPSLIYCDLGLPGKSGFDFLRDLRAKGASFKVLMLTAHSDRERVLQGTELGAVDYVAKPFDLPKLYKDTKLWLDILNAA